MIDQFRWWLFKLFSKWAYRLCPEPQRSGLQVLWRAGLERVREPE